MAGLWHRAKSSNQDQALMEVGPVLFPSQNTKKSIVLEALLTKEKKSSKFKFLQTFLPIFYTQVEFSLGDTSHLPTAHFSNHLGKTAHIPWSMGGYGTHRHMPGHFNQTLPCLAKTSGVTQQALIKCLMVYWCWNTYSSPLFNKQEFLTGLTSLCLPNPLKES